MKTKVFILWMALYFGVCSGLQSWGAQDWKAQLQALEHQQKIELREFDTYQGVKKEKWLKEKEEEKKGFFSKTLDARERKAFMVRQEKEERKYDAELEQERVRLFKEHEEERDRLEKQLAQKRIKKKTKKARKQKELR